jgi:para-nitrobenzyl esterase
MDDMKFYSEINRVVKTENGLLRGIKGANPIYTVYKGVPYAKPPVGDLRWKAPQPAESWDGVRDADKFSSIGYQHRFFMGSLYGKEFFQAPETMSEDCLYLNIWTPAREPDEKLPVLFWVHGGGLAGGYGFEPEFDGEGFCRRGVILVTINYRLGVFGFLAHPELSSESEHNVSGNYGHLDQAAALKWVRRNIAAFGGDPDNITIFGQSAGAGSVQTLISSPLTKGDIAKAIIQSGVGVDDLRGPMRARSLKQAEQSGAEFMEVAGCISITDMRKLDYDTFMKVPGIGFMGKFSFGTIIDNYLLTETAWQNIKSGKHCDIPYIVGNTSDEGNMMGSANVKMFIDNARSVYGNKANQFLKICDVKTDDDAARTSSELHTMMMGNRLFCELQVKNGRKPAYLYYFNRKLPGDDSGAFHSSELWYIFSTIQRCWRPMTGADYDLSNAMSSYWANFAKTGDPNGEGLPKWDAYTPSKPVNMVLGLEIETRSVDEKPVQKFVKDFVLDKLD